MIQLFDGKAIEALKKELEEKKAHIILLEVRIKVRDEKIESLNDKLNKHKADSRAALDQKDDEIGILKASLRKAREEINSCHIEKEKALYQVNEIRRKNATLNERPHNERGAGRKRKATPEQAELILSFAEQKLTLSEIARKLTEITGEKWNRATIRNTLSFVKRAD